VNTIKHCLVAVVILIQGCAASYKYTDKFENNRFNDGRYLATELDSRVVSTAFNGSSSNWFGGIAMIMAPLAIIDMPFSVVFDTITLPYDQYRHIEYQEDRTYWEAVINAPEIDLSLVEHREHYTEAGRYWLLWQMKREDHDRPEIGSAQLRLLFDLALEGEGTRNNEILAQVTRRSRAITSLSDYICSIVAHDIDMSNHEHVINNLFLTYTSNVTGGYDEPDLTRNCVTQLAAAGVDCQLLLRSPELPESQIRRCYSDGGLYYTNYLVRNPSVPLDIHEGLYKMLMNDRDGIGGMGLRAINQLKQLAGHTRSTGLMDTMIRLNDPVMDGWLLENRALPESYRMKLNGRK
jgi:uncharacterized protein YceK